MSRTDGVVKDISEGKCTKYYESKEKAKYRKRISGFG